MAGKTIGYAPPTALQAKLDAYCSESGRKRAEVINAAIEAYLAEMGAPLDLVAELRSLAARFESLTPQG